MKETILTIIILLLLTNKTQSQQLPVYNQYRLNEFLVNPAVAGYDGFTSINITGREQWIGIPNPPRTGTFSYQTRVLKKSFQIRSNPVRRNVLRKSKSGRVGIGGYLFSDNNGAVSQTGALFAYAYHIFIDNNQLSFGLSANFFQFDIDETLLTFNENEAIEDLEQLSKPFYIPDFNVGVNVSSYNYIFGFSVNQILASELGRSFRNFEEPIYRRHYYVMAKYRNFINTNWEYEPFVILKLPEGSRLQMDISNIFIYEKDYWFGLGYRRDYRFTDFSKSVNTFILLLGLRYDKVYFGYSFDYNLIQMLSNSLGSHEFVLALKFGDSIRRYRWLERY